MYEVLIGLVRGDIRLSGALCAKDPCLEFLYFVM